jgi:RNA recognition motif-containing protein
MTSTKSILVSGLTVAASPEEVKIYFSQVGTVEGVLLSNSGLKVKVTYATSEDATKAIDKFNGKSFRGDKLVIESESDKLDMNTSSVLNIIKLIQALDPTAKNQLTTTLLKGQSTIDDSGQFADGATSSTSDLQKGKSIHHSVKQGLPQGVQPNLSGANLQGMSFPHYDILRLPTFSGDSSKGDNTSYSQWKFELGCLVSEGFYSAPQILVSI